MPAVSILRVATLGAVAAALATACMAGGVPAAPPSDPDGQRCLTRREIRELRRHASGMTRILCEDATAAQAAMDHEAGKWARQTAYAKPSKDRYGDTMYVDYGPRAYAGTPCYNGPSYTASFEPNEAAPAWGANSRYYYQQPYAVMGTTVRYGSATGAGASHTYLQSGMVNLPGAWSPSAARPAGLNH